ARPFARPRRAGADARDQARLRSRRHPQSRQGAAGGEALMFRCCACGAAMPAAASLLSDYERPVRCDDCGTLQRSLSLRGAIAFFATAGVLVAVVAPWLAA